MLDAVRFFEGTVSQVTGDGITVLFGAPLAHEDHAVRACFAALRMQEMVKRHADSGGRARGRLVQARIGLDSGQVVVRDIGSDPHTPYMAVGRATHLASRLAELAAPGSVLATADTLRLAVGYVRVEPLGPMAVRGFGEPVEAYEVTGKGAVSLTAPGGGRARLLRFVGRDTELAQLQRAVAHAREGSGAGGGDRRRAGRGQVASRLRADMLPSRAGLARAGSPPGVVRQGDQLSASDRSPAGLFRGSATATRIGTSAKASPRGSVALDQALESTLPALLALLDVPVENLQWQGLHPSQRRHRTLDAVTRLVLRETQVQPLLVVIEDLQWIDTETQAFLDGLVERLPAAPLLLLVDYRPEYSTRLGEHDVLFSASPRSPVAGKRGGTARRAAGP